MNDAKPRAVRLVGPAQRAREAGAPTSLEVLHQAHLAFVSRLWNLCHSEGIGGLLPQARSNDHMAEMVLAEITRRGAATSTGLVAILFGCRVNKKLIDALESRDGAALANATRLMERCENMMQLAEAARAKGKRSGVARGGNKAIILEIAKSVCAGRDDKVAAAEICDKLESRAVRYRGKPYKRDTIVTYISRWRGVGEI